ncbi:MAG: hypothetical protein C4346_05695 [Chloroflexota bacterium]
MRHAVLGLILLWTAMFGIQSAAAQDPTPEPGPSAVKLLIDPAALGDGWSLHHTISPDALYPYSHEMSPAVFREGAAGIYVGPEGSRVIAVALLVTESRVAIRKSWEDASDLLHRFTANVSEDWDRERELETADPPAGCVEAKRTEGTEYGFGLPFGATMCAIDPDVILIVGVFGTVQERSGVAASDTIVTAMIPTDQVLTV